MMGVVALIGLAIGIVEFAIAALAYDIYRKTRTLEWLKIFAAAALVLGISHILCKFIGHGVLGLPESYAIGVPFKFVGVLLLIYALLKGVNYKKIKDLMIFATIVGLYFVVSSYYTLTVLQVEHTIFFSTSHLLFLLLLPWYVAAVLYKVYKESGDDSAMIFAIGLFVYGLATVINMLFLSLGVPLMISMSIALIARLLGLIIILGGFIMVTRS